MENLSPQDRRNVQHELATLPARVNAAKESEMGEMMGKLKEVTARPFALSYSSSQDNCSLTSDQLGNGILKPFGLSTDMFKMTKDPATGGYSMSFDQGNK